MDYKYKIDASNKVTIGNLYRQYRQFVPNFDIEDVMRVENDYALKTFAAWSTNADKTDISQEKCGFILIIPQ